MIIFKLEKIIYSVRNQFSRDLCVEGEGCGYKGILEATNVTVTDLGYSNWPGLSSFSDFSFSTLMTCTFFYMYVISMYFTCMLHFNKTILNNVL